MATSFEQIVPRTTKTDLFNRASRVFNAWCAHPSASALAITLVIAWVALGPYDHFSDTWQLVMNTSSSIVTFLMVFIIANAQKRDTDALLLKLDLLIAANPNATNAAVALEHQPEHVAEQVRREVRELQRGAE